MVKNLPAIQETWVWSLGQEDPLEKAMVFPSGILACIIPRTEEIDIKTQSKIQFLGHTRLISSGYCVRQCRL